MQQFDYTKRFHLLARTWDNQERLLKEFDDERQFDFMIDSVDYNKYSESMILDENHHCLRYYEEKDYTPYFKTQSKSKSKRLKK